MANIKRLNTDGSREAFVRAQKALVEGVSSPSRGPANFGDYPIFLVQGEGAYVKDVDGNRYVDLMMAYGALLLGHSHPTIVHAIQEAASQATLFAAASPIETDVAQLIFQRVPQAQRVRFANTGTEATMAALRLARGLSGKERFIKFEGHYHGWYDDYLVSAHPHPYIDLGLPSHPVAIAESSGLPQDALRHAVLVPWNDLELLERALKAHQHELACVITEGVMANMGVIPPNPGYLESVQELCRQYGVLFVLDETVTGFRLAPGGAAERYGLDPDLLTYGKGLGAGLPVAALAGKAEYMEGLRWGGVLHYGTQNASYLGLSVAKANLKALDHTVYARLESMGLRLQQGLTTLLKSHHIVGRVQRVGGMLQLFFGTEAPITDFRDFCRSVDRQAFNRFAIEVIRHGVYLSPSASLHSVLSAQHGPNEIDRVLEVADYVMDLMKGRLP
ncbi:MAG: aspartate aminotransferase family protein [Sulfobacillus acidophilus]|uniref:Aspartate aminotransferase family protein n=1 Tax=Sulfobacillus acidophilus TaxID=53633 RepID=A0A2T2WGJ9_9FIRM|nr:MAG: aspartate aminotransferase family protein [Sulfobacillus acidophilus]